MKIIILGSGGFLSTPRAGCFCRICIKARKEGRPFKRNGPSFFLPGSNTLFDTPEDIGDSLNYAKIRRVENIIYTHWHPDHTLGYRVIESLSDNDFFSKKHKPINVYIPSRDVANFKKIIPGLWYLENKGYISIHKISTTPLRLNKEMIKSIPLDNSTFHAYLIEKDRKKILLCPDHSMHLPIKNELKNVQILIMNMGYIKNRVRGRESIPENHHILSTTGFEKDNLRLIEGLIPKKVFLTHIEEKFNRTPAELDHLVRQYPKYTIQVAHDGMIVG